MSWELLFCKITQSAYLSQYVWDSQAFLNFYYIYSDIEVMKLHLLYLYSLLNSQDLIINSPL